MRCKEKKTTRCLFCSFFLRATARTAKLVLAVVILSVCPSVCPTRPGTDSRPGEIETPGNYRMGSIVPLLSCEQISCRLVRSTKLMTLNDLEIENSGVLVIFWRF